MPPTIPEMLHRLDMLYDQEDKLLKEAAILKKRYNQLLEDKEVLQMMIMHQSNKKHRGGTDGNI